MTFVGAILPAEQGPDGDAVEYATITIKVPINRIGSVFGCMRNLHRQDKRLSKISYRKHTKVTYAERAGPSSSSSMSDDSESSTTDTDTSESSISEMIRTEVSKILSENNYTKVVPPVNKPTSNDERNPQLVVQSGAKLCECEGFQNAMNKAREYVTDSRSVLYDQVLWAVNRARYETKNHVATTKLGMPCNLTVQDRTIICTGQCKAVSARKTAELDKIKARKVEEALQESKRSFEEERHENRSHKSFIKQMKTVVPSNKEVEKCQKEIWASDAYDRYKDAYIRDYARLNALRCYRIDGKFYNAVEFNEKYRGMGWFRKKQWNNNNN